MYLAASSRGLVYAGPFHAAFSEMKQWLAARYPGYELVESEAWLQPYAASLAAYFEGRRTGEWPPLDLSGTPFQRSVWQALLEIPYGETRTYAEIASRIGKPSAVRAVASAIGANPALVFVPCHRVIGKNGELRGFRGGLDMKRALLDLESR
jgi:methylated-DNA-[protein]-cysteine S-methyltransferase